MILYLRPVDDTGRVRQLGREGKHEYDEGYCVDNIPGRLHDVDVAGTGRGMGRGGERGRRIITGRLI